MSRDNFRIKVMLSLTLTAELIGCLFDYFKSVTDLQPVDNEENPFYYTFKVQCTSCREIHPNWESNEMSGSRGTANFVWRCKNCKREHTATIQAAPKPYKQAEPPTRQNIVEIDCRGLEFVDFRAEGEFQAASSESTTKFTGIELMEGEWYDYDEKTSEEVSVRECKWEIRRA